MNTENLPPLMALFNGLALTLLLVAIFFIKRKMKTLHITAALMATASSMAFLTCYILYHIYKTSPRIYEGSDFSKAIYLIILFTHIALAPIVAVLVPSLIVLALRKKFDKHKNLARVTIPLWLYVSTSGIAIYFFLK